MENPEVKLKTFFGTDGEFVTTMVLEVENRNLDEILSKLPKEFIGYFYDQFVGIINGIEYPFGPKMNASNKYYKCSRHYSAEEISSHSYSELHDCKYRNAYVEALEKDEFFASIYPYYSAEKYPQGITIIEGIITNPGKDGIIIVKKTNNNNNNCIHPSK